MEPTTRLSAVLVDVQLDEKVKLFVTPLTTVAEALGNARLARGDKEPDYVAAHARALELIGNHFGAVDLILSGPADPTTATAGTLSEPARHGLVLAALSQLSARIAEESSVSTNVVNSIVLMDGLMRDVASDEALFDGKDASGESVAIGSCPAPDICGDIGCNTICDMGPRTVRERLSSALDAFVASTAPAAAQAPWSPASSASAKTFKSAAAASSKTASFR